MVTQHCQAQGIEQSAYRFSRRDVRGFVGWTDFQIKKHMTRLQEMEYLLVHRGGRGHSFVYELLYQGEGDNGQPFLLGRPIAALPTATVRAKAITASPSCWACRTWKN